MRKIIRFVDGRAEVPRGYAAYLHRQGRELLSKSLSGYFNIDFSEDMLFFGEKGKPYLLDVFFNIAHTDGMVCLALSDRENGADCEKLKSYSENAIKRCFCEKEAKYVYDSGDRDLAFVRLWTLKEAYSKLIGEGISALKSAVFDLSEEKADFDCGCDFYQYVINGKFCAAFCEKGGSGKIFLEFTDFDIDNSDILLYNI